MASTFVRITLKPNVKAVKRRFFLRVERDTPGTISGYEVDRSGDEITPQGFENRFHVIQKDAVKKTERMEVDHKYGELVPVGTGTQHMNRTASELLRIAKSLIADRDDEMLALIQDTLTDSLDDSGEMRWVSYYDHGNWLELIDTGEGVGLEGELRQEDVAQHVHGATLKDVVRWLAENGAKKLNRSPRLQRRLRNRTFPD